MKRKILLLILILSFVLGIGLSAVFAVNNKLEQGNINSILAFDHQFINNGTGNVDLLKSNCIFKDETDNKPAIINESKEAQSNNQNLEEVEAERNI